VELADREVPLHLELADVLRRAGEAAAAGRRLQRHGGRRLLIEGLAALAERL
jgi:hypothetical protein